MASGLTQAIKTSTFSCMKKEEKLEQEFLDILSQFKNQETAIKINKGLIDLENIDQMLLHEIHGYIKAILRNRTKNQITEPPDIIA